MQVQLGGRSAAQRRGPTGRSLSSGAPFVQQHGQRKSSRSVAWVDRASGSVSATQDNVEVSSASAPAYPYNDADGKRQKATIEHIFPALEASTSSSAEQQHATASGRPQAPWQMGWQMNERNVYWSDDLKVRLIKRIAAEELGVADEEMDSRLQQLGALLPGLESRLGKAPPKLVARLAAHTGEVARRLLALKMLFPQANLAAMVNNRLTLLLDDDMAVVAAAEARLRVLLPDLNVDRFVETHPLVLDIDVFEMALEDARRIMPGTDITSVLRSDPDIILSLVKGKALLPYDQISNPWA